MDDALQMYEDQLKKLVSPVDFKKYTVCVPSYLEMYPFLLLICLLYCLHVAFATYRAVNPPRKSPSLRILVSKLQDKCKTQKLIMFFQLYV